MFILHQFCFTPFCVPLLDYNLIFQSFEQRVSSILQKPKPKPAPAPPADTSATSGENCSGDAKQPEQPPTSQENMDFE